MSYIPTPDSNGNFGAYDECGPRIETRQKNIDEVAKLGIKIQALVFATVMTGLAIHNHYYPETKSSAPQGNKQK
ncbi:hypothetical protein CL656_01330 [bacterium]|nr:hypothetical protein [bacterium]|tara:strand:+ start:768 stop:989 length:222 start_codon:yes stop_codon:yes gene_type:complete